VFQKNDQAAAENRARLHEHGIVCVNLLGGAGCGKTALLEAILPRLGETLRAGVLEGDLATTRDADRIAALNVPVVQLLTDGGCHLNATLVQHALDALPLADLDVVIIENVGNPICPTNFDLGEHLRVSMLSVAEGDDKPSKYGLLFGGMDAVVISKCDLLEHTDFNLLRAEEDIRRLNAGAAIFQTSRRDPRSTDAVAEWLAAACRRIRARNDHMVVQAPHR